MTQGDVYGIDNTYVVTQGDVYGIDNTYVVTQGDVYGIDNTYVATAALLQYLETDIIPRVLKKSKASDLFAFLNMECGQSLVYDNTISMGHDTLVRLLVGRSTAKTRESDTARADYVIDALSNGYIQSTNLDLIVMYEMYTGESIQRLGDSLIILLWTFVYAVTTQHAIDAVIYRRIQHRVSDATIQTYKRYQSGQ